jgi:signal peptidase
MRSRLRTAAGIASIVLVLGIIVMVGILTVPSVIGAKESFVVLSGSMAPQIQQGDVVVVRSTPPRQIETGEVITYRVEGDLGGEGIDRVTHRVVERRQTADGLVFVTKGDANERRDSEPVEPPQIIGGVWFHIPAIGWLILLAQRPVGNVLFLVVPGLLLIGTGLRTLRHAVSVEEGDQR